MLENPILSNSRAEFKQFPQKLNEHLLNLGAPHVDSFNEMLEHGFNNCVQHMHPVQFQTPAGERVLLRIEHISIDNPRVPKDLVDVTDKLIYPSEPRQTHRTYAGVLTVHLAYSINNDTNAPIYCNLGAVPIMLKSNACNLANLTPEQMVQKSEHDSEWGGIFIIKGNEKIMRMLLMTRRNFPVSIKRSSWRERGQHFSDIGVMMRCVRRDETSYNNVLHYLNNGTAKLMFAHNKLMSYVPVCLILKVLLDITDMEIYRRIVRGYETDLYYVSCVENMLRELHEQGLHTQLQCKQYLGKVFRPRFPEVPSWYDDAQVLDFILNERIFIHLDKHAEKFDLLVFMLQKVFQCVQAHRKIENVDSVMLQEVLLPGHLYQKYLLDRIDIWLNYVKKSILKRLEGAESLLTPAIMAQVMRSAGGVQRAMESFLATGNASSRSGLGLMQNSGLVVMAENINRMRYMSHFRAVHRGSFFTTMRTTEARQLLPDAWGFICPVHTPDGAPCGLLNHLTLNCKVSSLPKQHLVDAIPSKLIELGMITLDSAAYNADIKYLVVLLDGKLLGYIPQIDVDKVIYKLRALKIEGILPEMLEIGFIPDKEKGQFPGLFLFAGPARFMRPVHNIALNQVEYIGSLEQVYMNIAIEAKEAYADHTTHMELSKTGFLSNLANLIPLPDHNQSPRNMYQCQMGKQTMGTPLLNWPQQSANKLYRLQTPATPLFRPVHYDNLGMDDFAMGSNAVVAVISYTGYDMEDAMIINKMTHERGFAYGSIYKTKFIELPGSSYFARNPNLPDLARYIDNDGLPQSGTKLSHSNPLYCYYDSEEAIYKVCKLDEKEDCIVDSVRLCGALKLNAARCACITLRIPRAPTVGDKFASRAGQKGICSQRYPAEDLPFTEGGIIPDIVFNPHGFPSRMTIAMMIEVMAGKSSALHGLVHDATPFRFSEKHTPIDYFGKLLEAGGYNYFGTERLYSGVDGREMLADIFFGVVHYQRLRHMVFDKYQVRSTGPVDAITQQPIKGRKRGGGVRFGEMERDALISHGAAFLLQDRLFTNSDKIYSLICRKCGSILAPITRVVSRTENGKLKSVPETCRLCGNGAALSNVEIPASFKYLITELSSVNINARLKTADV